MGIKKILSFFTLENIQKVIDFLKSIEPQYGHLEAYKISFIIAEDSQRIAKMISSYPATLKRMRQLMGFLPTSERTSSFIKEEDEKPEIVLTEEEKKAQQEALKKRCEEDPKFKEAQNRVENAKDEMAKYKKTIEKIKNRSRKFLIQENIWKKIPKLKKVEPINELSEESIFTTPICSIEKETIDVKVQNVQEFFGKTVGLHKTIEQTKRVDLQLVLKETEYNVETITDFNTGLSVRADVSAYGPAGFNVTWNTLATLVKLHYGFAIPMNRLAMMIGHKTFESSHIYELLEVVGKKFLNIYLALPEELSEAPILRGDDTDTKLLEVSDPIKKSDENQNPKIHEIIDNQLGWRFPKKRGFGFKQKINTSFIMGQVGKDSRSTIAFFRTHFGGLGNLITKILEYRRPSSGPIITQGDSSAANLASDVICKKIKVNIAGCMAHARRPFWRYKENDSASCYFLIRAFMLLSSIEKKAKEEIFLAQYQNKILSKEEKDQIILGYRQRFGRRIWTTIQNFCKKILGEDAQVNTNISKIIVWPKSTPLNTAAQYVLTHFDELTYYLNNADVFLTNNISERAARYEKVMLAGCKFRKTRNGRAILDILKTILATSNFAKIEFKDYLKWVWEAGDAVDADPTQFTPYAFACYLDKKQQFAATKISSVA